jgi:type VI secretion system protein ImpH
VGAESGKQDPPLKDTPLEQALRERPQAFSFFQAVRLMNRFSGREPVGEYHHPAEESAQFGGNATLAFPPAEIHSIEERGDQPPRMRVNFMGLAGALGVLPVPYTELVIERLQAKDSTLRDFLDIFNHRLVSLFYRAWLRSHFAVEYERRGEDPLSRHVLSLLGLGTAGLEQRLPLPDSALVFYSGLVARYPRSAEAVARMLSDYFGVPVAVHPFSGAWRPLDPGSRTVFRGDDSPCEQLGVGAVLGDEVWDQQCSVRIRMGPLSLKQYKRFLPDGAAHNELRALARFLCGEDLDVEVQLVLDREETPRFGLDADTETPRLGWISWMFSRPLDRDPDETILRFY